MLAVLPELTRIQRQQDLLQIEVRACLKCLVQAPVSPEERTHEFFVDEVLDLRPKDTFLLHRAIVGLKNKKFVVRKKGGLWMRGFRRQI